MIMISFRFDALTAQECSTGADNVVSVPAGRALRLSGAKVPPRLPER
jgi:hypothetical protein